MKKKNLRKRARDHSDCKAKYINKIR
jgi:hypothetical protein